MIVMDRVIDGWMEGSMVRSTDGRMVRSTDGGIIIIEKVEEHFLLHCESFSVCCVIDYYIFLAYEIMLFFDFRFTKMLLPFVSMLRFDFTCWPQTFPSRDSELKERFLHFSRIRHQFSLLLMGKNKEKRLSNEHG